jgi:hypothetical protein
MRRRRVGPSCVEPLVRLVCKTAHLVRFGVSLEARYTEPR